MNEATQLRKELTSLRVSIARLAQVLGVTECESMPIHDFAYENLWLLAATKERGWNYLLAECMEKVQDRLAFVAQGCGELGSGHGAYTYVFDTYDMALAFTKRARLEIDPATNDHYPISWDVYPCDFEASTDSAMEAFRYVQAYNAEESDHENE